MLQHFSFSFSRPLVIGFTKFERALQPSNSYGNFMQTEKVDVYQAGKLIKRHGKLNVPISTTVVYKLFYN